MPSQHAHDATRDPLRVVQLQKRIGPVAGAGQDYTLFNLIYIMRTTMGFQALRPLLADAAHGEPRDSQRKRCGCPELDRGDSNRSYSRFTTP